MITMGKFTTQEGEGSSNERILILFSSRQLLLPSDLLRLRNKYCMIQVFLVLFKLHIQSEQTRI